MVTFYFDKLKLHDIYKEIIFLKSSITIKIFKV